MESGKTSAYRTLAVLFLIWLLSPAVAHAGPSPSMSHIPVLWLFVVVAALLMAMVPLLIRNLVKPRRAAWPFWLAAPLLALLFLIFIGPIIVALGSMIITGRTM